MSSRRGEWANYDDQGEEGTLIVARFVPGLIIPWYRSSQR